jgi:hypothetical protein
MGKKQKLRRRSKRPLRLEWVEAGSLSDNPRNWRQNGSGAAGPRGCARTFCQL